MDPQAPASFIPKKPLDSGKSFREGSNFGILFFIALFVFAVSLVAAGGVFVYQGVLTSSLADKSASLAKAEGAFDLPTIQDLVRMDSRINSARTLLQNHVAPSALFAFLSGETLQNVQFISLDYTLGSDNSATIAMAGQADTFSTVALQSDQFGANKLLKNVIFSDIKVNTDGTVSFSVSATLDPSLINYAKNLGGMPASVPAPANIPSTPAGTSTPSN